MLSGGAWGAEFSLLKIVAMQQQVGSFGFNPTMIPALLAYLIFLPGTMGVVPFDIPEAETELIEGPLLEYGGPLLALFQITSALKTFVVLGLGVALFFPGTISDIWLVNLVWFLAQVPWAHAGFAHAGQIGHRALSALTRPSVST